MGRHHQLQRLPNLVSYSRLLFAAGFAVAGRDARIGLLGAAAASDFLDGWVARRTRTASRWGALLDPIADRTFTLVAVTSFLVAGVLSTAGYFVMLSRDLATAIGFLVARVVPRCRGMTFRARWPGKIVTTLQLLTFLCLLVRPTWAAPLLLAVAAASAWAITDYAVALWRGRAIA